MDILDIILARAMTPQGKTETYVAKANAAAAKAEKAEQDATTVINTVEAAADEIATAREEAAALLEEAQNTLETAQQAQINFPESYDTTGQNIDGYMTQKAVTDALNDKVSITNFNTALSQKADAVNTVTKQYVDSAIASIPHTSTIIEGGGNTNLGSENAGYLVVVGEDGNIKPGDVNEMTLISSLINSGTYVAREAVGLEIDYAGKAVSRIQEAVSLNMGTDFNSYIMYGGRMRCNVTDDGTITAFYGDANYKEDGSNGQVMVYQPKFYYQRIPLNVQDISNGRAVRHETLILSAKKQTGFKLHPIFNDGNGGELDYVLFSAYNGSLVDNKLASIANVKPAANMNITQAETYATARGNGWHINNMAAISANQMLQVVEYGSMNGQASFEDGVSNLPKVTSDINCSAITGSTAALGNETGHAESTINDNNGVEVTNTQAGERAISYRGLENPWGNLWNFIGGCNIYGDGTRFGGSPYICIDFNYTPDTIGDNYEYIGFNLPNTYGWISAMGCANQKYDWIFMPIECSNTANSLLPVGDNLWTVANVDIMKTAAVGGSYSFKDNNGLFYYACDNNVTRSASNFGARLMYIPTKNSIYTANISKWENKIGE